MTSLIMPYDTTPDTDAGTPRKEPPEVSAQAAGAEPTPTGGFSYIGRALTAAEFLDYIRTYNFGSIPPSYLVIHNTYNPDASWAPISSSQSTWWDRNESGMSSEQIKSKRKPQLDAIKNYYVGLGWSTGPHLFVDERWIWLFTPMYDVGTHAASGNSYRDSAGTLHYSIGIETVGYFQSRGWPETMQKLLQVVTQGLRDRLRNYEIVYKDAPLNRPDLHDHSISFHNDYNKEACPGSIITPGYAIPILRTPYTTTYKQVRIIAPCAVLQDRAADAPLAIGPDNGATWLEPGNIVNVDDKTNGWLHISDRADTAPGIGYICASYATAI